MNWTELLKAEIRSTYATTDKLLDFVDPNALQWKPPTGNNWMTVGQLLMHLTQACGPACRGFVAGDWGMPDGVDITKLKPEEMLPAAEKLPSLESVAVAKRLLQEDQQVTLDLVAACGEDRLTHDKAPAP